MQEIRDQKAIRHIENKQLNDRIPSLLVVSLNVNGLSSPIKGERVAEQTNIRSPPVGDLLDTHRLKVKGGEKILHANDNQKRTGMATLTLDEIDFK